MRAGEVSSEAVARCPQHRLDPGHYDAEGLCSCTAAKATTGSPPYLPRPPKETPALYAQDGKGYGATVWAHYFLGGSDWLVTEYDPGEDMAFGWACLHGDRQNAELGYTSLTELAGAAAPLRLTDEATGQVVTVPRAVRVEYDDDWEPCSLTAGIALLDERQGRAER